MSSIFCINPPGDTPTRKGVFDSLVLGCIPVITQAWSLSQYRWHIPNWRSVSEVIPYAQLMAKNKSIIEHLVERIKNDPVEIQSKLVSARRLAYSLQYSKKDGPRGLDAFQVTLKKLLERKISLIKARHPSRSE